MGDKMMGALNRDAEVIIEQVFHRKRYGYEVRDNLAEELLKIISKYGGRYPVEKGNRKMKYTVTIDAVLVSETEGRLLVDVGEKLPVWLPKYCCTYDEAKQTITMPEGLAVEMELV